ncbi:Lacal_2735 family protein [Sungkyunkwania multivorans]|uniref:Lacal_2735 family protein n=1 Tax=Sungkyunkwania multivorans TaxID=1173618 RepID=A0ABW3D2U2_9FLAO
MKTRISKLRRRFTQAQLEKRYKILVERAYNFRQTDAALSDFCEYEAQKILEKLERLQDLDQELSFSR